LIVTANGANSKDTHSMLSDANTTLMSLFPKESMIISPQNGMHEEKSNSMGNSMTGESTHSTDSSESGSNQFLPNKADESTSSDYTMPGGQHESGSPSESPPKPMQGDLDSSDTSGEHQMMR